MATGLEADAPAHVLVGPDVVGESFTDGEGDIEIEFVVPRTGRRQFLQAGRGHVRPIEIQDL